MLDLESAIKHAEEVAEEQDMRAGFKTDYSCYQMSDTERNQCKKCAEEHRQLAEWLREYKELKSNIKCRNNAYWRPEKTGGYSPGGNPLYKCSNCGWVFGTHMIVPNYKYCPECGSLMKNCERNDKNVSHC